MKKLNVIMMSWDEYNELLSKVTDGKVSIGNTDGNWDYLCEIDYDYETEEIHELVAKELNVKIVDVIIDISNDGDCVAIVIK